MVEMAVGKDRQTYLEVLAKPVTDALTERRGRLRWQSGKTLGGVDRHATWDGKPVNGATGV